MIAMALPTILLYEAAILAVARVERSRASRAKRRAERRPALAELTAASPR